jgi:3-dehydroquinate dehydratase II
LASIFVLNGVNLDTLGERRPELYGEQTLEHIEQLLREVFPNVKLAFRPTNHEGKFVAWIHEAANADGLILNPGAWTHYSYAIHDVLESVSAPKVEVHRSNVHSREGRRRESMISPAVDAVVTGMGAYGYRAAVGYVLGAAARD